MKKKSMLSVLVVLTSFLAFESLFFNVFADTKAVNPSASSALPIGITDFELISYELVELVDKDNDGYFSSATLNITVSVGEENACLGYIAVSVCKYPDELGPCPYTTIEMSCFNDTSTFSIPLGLPNNELIQGTYQIKFLVYEYTESSIVFDWTDVEIIQMESSDEDQLYKPVFSIGDVYTDNKIDYDEDCCGRSRDLYFDANVSCGTYDVWAKIYYKLSGKKDWTEYKSTETFTITDNETDYRMVTIGPDSKFVHNEYDFAVELYNDSTIVAEKCPYHDCDIKQICFERPSEDKAVLIDTFYWSKMEDWDSDGAFSYAEMTVELKAVSSYNIFVILNGYAEASAPLVTSDIISVVPGKNIITLKVKELGVSSKIYWCPEIEIVGAKLGEFIDLVNYFNDLVRFEPQWEDMVFELASFSITDLTDNDGDGYYSYAKLNIDIDAQPITGKVNVDVSMCKKPIFAGPCIYLQTPNFEVNSSNDDIYSIELGTKYANKQLNHGTYQLDFKVNDSLTNSQILGWIFVDTLHMETPDEDIAIEIDTAFWINLTDHDGDGYSSSGDLVTVFNVYAPVEDVFLELYGLKELSVLMKTSGAFNISLTDFTDTMHYTGIDSSYYGGGFVFLKKQIDNSMLDNKSIPPVFKFETPEQDLIYELESFELSDMIDNDGDGYFSYAKLNVNVDAVPVASDVFMEVSMCKHPVLAGPCDYLITEDFSVTDTPDDMYSVDIGIPNDELSHGTYQLDFNVYDAGTMEMAIGWTFVDNIKMENQTEDILISCIENSMISSLIIYPNPFNADILLEFENARSYEEITILLLNSQGSIIHELYKGYTKDRYSEQHNLEYLSPGLYILRIITPDTYSNIKLLKY